MNTSSHPSSRALADPRLAPRRAASRRRARRRRPTRRLPDLRRVPAGQVHPLRRGPLPRFSDRRARGRRLGQRPPGREPDGLQRPPLRGRGGARRAAEPHLRRLRARRRRLQAARAGELRRGRALGRQPPPRGVRGCAPGRVPGASPGEDDAGTRACGSRARRSRRPERGLGRGRAEVGADGRQFPHPCHGTTFTRTAASHSPRCATAIELHDGQLGTLAAIGGEIQVLDWVSRPDAFAVLHGPLVQGYALDALEFNEEEAADTPEPETARGFTLLVTDCEPDQRSRAVGLGEGLSFADQGVYGTAVAYEGELIQLTAFPEDLERSTRERVIRTGRVRRPSRRR